jgi:hypothetical protein
MRRLKVSYKEREKYMRKVQQLLSKKKRKPGKEKKN